MKVMYVACRAEKQQTLQIEKEITDLQRRSFETSGEPVIFEFMPSLALAELPLELDRRRPDILHIAAHGGDGRLMFGTVEGGEAAVSGAMLQAFVTEQYAPRLLYISACESKEIACDALGKFAMTIGMTAPISNLAARNSALLFYSRLMAGLTVQEAFEAGKAIVEATDDVAIGTELHNRPDIDPCAERFHTVPRIVARFAEGQSLKARPFALELGLVGSRQDTIQVVFFTDDEDFFRVKEEKWEKNASIITRTAAVRGTIWSQYDEWLTRGDHRVFAAATTNHGEVYSVSSTLCHAIEAYYSVFEKLAPDQIGLLQRTAIQKLRDNDGSLG